MALQGTPTEVCSCVRVTTWHRVGNTGRAAENDYAHVSRVFTRLLSAQRYVDIVASDIAAGLILLRHVQKAEVSRPKYLCRPRCSSKAKIASLG